jgi:L-ribulose-5-phosphate 3-epimerase
MSSSLSRRKFIYGAGLIAASSSFSIGSLAKSTKRTKRVSSPFKLSIFNDEISQDFGRAVEVISNDLGLGYIEIRSMWNKNIMRLDSKEIAEAVKILKKYRVKASNIAGPLFKVDWPGAPVPKNNLARDQFKADFTYEQQDEVLERGIELARTFGTNHLRCFDFWRLDDQKPYRDAINEKLRDAAIKAGKHGITLVMENEFACNTATAVEAAQTLAAVNLKSFKLCWDPGNSAYVDEVPYPTGYNLIPKGRIGHVHCKDVAIENGEKKWMKVGGGVVDFLGQFRALKKDGYRGAVVLETHWRGAQGTQPEASTRESWASMKDLLQRAGAA